MAGGRRYYGSVRKLPSGRWQARARGADGKLHPAKRADGGPLTFDTKGTAEAWCALRQAEVMRGELYTVPPAPRRTTFAGYASRWVESRDLAPATRKHYRDLLRLHLLPELGGRRLTELSPGTIVEWYDAVAPGKRRAKAQSYSLLRTILGDAVREHLLDSNPCQIRGGGTSRRQAEIRPASVAELGSIAAAMPDRLRLAVLLAAWCAMRYEEVAELRRSDVDLTNGVLRLRRAVSIVNGQRIVKDLKSDAGRRDVHLPPHLLPAVEDHLDQHAQTGRDGLLFPDHQGRQLALSTLNDRYRRARHAAGRDDLTYHGLRHTGAVLAAATGATVAELMARLGHSTPTMALRYQHAAAERDREIARKLSAMVETDVPPATGTGGK
jgi:integrase